MTKSAIAIRATRPDESRILPEIERSAGQAFRAIADLAWVADDDVLSVNEHRRLAGLGTSWVALAGDRAVGFVCAERIGPDVHIWEAAVRCEEQGRGIGTRLMRAVQLHAVETGVERLTLTTFRGVPWNEGLYRRLGFRLIEPAQLDERLRQVLEEEAAAGFPAERRCAMHMSIEAAS